LSQAEFCRRQGLDRRRLHFWKDLLERERSPGPAPAVDPVCAPVRSVPVTVELPTALCAAPGRSASRAALTVVTGTYRIEVGDDFRADTLVRLLTTRERR